MNKFFSILILILFFNFSLYSQTYSTFNVVTYDKVPDGYEFVGIKLASCKFTFKDDWVKWDWAYDDSPRYYKVIDIKEEEYQKVYLCSGQNQARFIFIIDDAHISMIHTDVSGYREKTTLFMFTLE